MSGGLPGKLLKMARIFLEEKTPVHDLQMLCFLLKVLHPMTDPWEERYVGLDEWLSCMGSM